MVERYVEQLPAIIATFMDERVKKNSEARRLQKTSDDDVSMAEEFLKIMKVLKVSTTSMSSEKLPTAGLILPMLSKIEKLFSVSEEDSTNVQAIKQAVWGDLMLRYGNDDLRE